MMLVLSFRGRQLVKKHLCVHVCTGWENMGQSVHQVLLALALDGRLP